MTKDQGYFWRVAIERLRLDVAHLHFEAIRENLIMPRAWCDSLDAELSKFAGRLALDVEFSPAVSDPAARGVKLDGSKIKDGWLNPSSMNKH